jgi:hypothetical protein
MTDQAEHPRLDRWLSVAAAVVVAAVLAATVALWASAPSGPATFDLDVDATAERVEVDVSNDGGEVATEVVVRATFDDGTEVDQTVAWLSPGETNRVVFLPPTTSGEVDVEIVSFAPND